MMELSWQDNHSKTSKTENRQIKEINLLFFLKYNTTPENITVMTCCFG
ncbi:MAG: hypothetical protein LBJ72_01675 [Dysgonamonadaceae bacterium]|nr:hypothetical protein [Dysgonamonadaceae bacterium]